MLRQSDVEDAQELGPFCRCHLLVPCGHKKFMFMMIWYIVIDEAAAITRLCFSCEKRKKAVNRKSKQKKTLAQAIGNSA